MRLFHILLASLLIGSTCHAAYIHGDIYDADFKKHNGTVINVQGRFSYQLVANHPNYSVFLPEGDYNVSASYFDGKGDLVLHAMERVSVGSQDQRVDLVLKPVDNDLPVYAAALMLLLLVAAVAGFRLAGRKPQKSQARQKKAEPDEEGRKVLGVIESLGGRVTQKELRLELKYPDAKLSLILSELEAMGRIRRFRRGRGNIIRLEERKGSAPETPS